jgi:hypothetical protein
MDEGETVVEIARYFQIQRVYQLISKSKEEGEYPALKRSGKNINQSMKGLKIWSSKRIELTI